MNPLKSFSPCTLPISLNAEIGLATATAGCTVQLHFELFDPQRLVQNSFVPGKFSASKVQRVDGLWQSTCFEAFWGVPGSSAYWELNLSPNGQAWNLYSFSGYRDPQPPKACADFELVDLTIGENSLACSLRSALELVEIEGALTAVVKTTQEQIYFASHHAGAKPDFHLRSSFLLRRKAMER